jgi:hypothetical protein
MSMIEPIRDQWLVVAAVAVLVIAWVVWLWARR